MRPFLSLARAEQYEIFSKNKNSNVKYIFGRAKKNFILFFGKIRYKLQIFAYLLLSNLDEWE